MCRVNMVNSSLWEISNTSGMTSSQNFMDMMPPQTHELSAVNAIVVPGRACGTCSQCCKVLTIVELAKPTGEWCAFWRARNGCTIHTKRPAVCRGFYCEWMISTGLGAEWKPEKAKIVLVKSNSGRRLTAHVDPGSPSAWRRSPYYENLKAWAVQAVQKRPQMDLVDVMIGERVIVILPDREVDLGIVGPEESVQLHRVATAAGELIDARKIKRVQTLLTFAINVIGDEKNGGGPNPAVK